VRDHERGHEKPDSNYLRGIVWQLLHIWIPREVLSFLEVRLGGSGLEADRDRGWTIAPIQLVAVW
jgi:hypothetical protein